ncbi:MAG: RNA polymerase sigma factor [bacterium]|jgi:RNA polymerase sigma-70 factor (ECF subfamily)|nr:RNA polymerase sigma factor [bacterium]
MSDQVHDHIAIEEVVHGNRDAFRPLVERYHGTVYRIAYSMCGNAEEAQDAVQEVFYRAFRNLKSYQPQWAFTTWIRRITVNYMLDQRKKKKVKTQSITTEDDQVIEIPDNQYDPRREYYDREKNRLVLDAINQLPNKYREVLVLRHIENMSYEEIAQSLSLPLGTVMTHLHRARGKLAELLKPMQTEIV